MNKAEEVEFNIRRLVDSFYKDPHILRNTKPYVLAGFQIQEILDTSLKIFNQIKENKFITFSRAPSAANACAIVYVANVVRGYRMGMAQFARRLRLYEKHGIYDDFTVAIRGFVK